MCSPMLHNPSTKLDRKQLVSSFKGPRDRKKTRLQQKLANKINAEVVGKIDSQRQENVFGGMHHEGLLATNDIENGKDSIVVSTKIVD